MPRRPFLGFEAKAEPGGMLRYGIPEHRLDTDFVRREIRDVTDLGVEIRCGEAVTGREGLDGLLADGCSAVYVATGAWRGVALDAANRPAEGLLDALVFLGMSREAQEAAEAMVRGRQVAVIGGGDTAMDAAVTAARLGAADVYVLYRRSFSQMPGEARERDQALAAGVHFLLLTRPLDYLSDGAGLTGVVAARTRLGEADGSGRRRPVTVPGSEHELAFDVVIEAIGQEAGPAPEGDLIFAGGDAVRGPSLVARAIGDGKAAAAAISARLAGGR